ncbi:hypothetical protein [Kitasatospora purpeofusca]|uniref:hypothetical protein n=1 Tax=Kitasatospora purpeofusca TaxID=67352 RepID=UPI002A5A5DF9|nr:hypothetical protein [Kitasatospora purpeofusca]MDY0811087.1 hypothetical protein [Kitasatospora purpeofusca]
MKRIAPVRTTTLVAAAVLAGAVAWAAVPATATSPTAHRAAPVPALTLDFKEAPTGKAFSTGRISDGDGKKVGTAYSLCDQDAIAAQAKTAFCTTMITFDVDNGQDQVSYNVMFPVTEPASGVVYRGLVTGGTGAYEGITGNAEITLDEDNTFRVAFN